MIKKIVQVSMASLFLMVISASFITPVLGAENIIKIGVHGPMKHTLGRQGAMGAKMAAAEINAAGGVKVGKDVYKIEVFPADDDCYASIPNAVNAVQRLISSHGVNCVIGGYTSESTLAIQEICANYRTIQFVTGAATNKLAARIHENYDKYKYMFKLLGPRPETQVPFFISATLVPGVRAIRAQLGIEKPKVAIIRDKAVYSEPFAAIVKEMAAGIGYEVIGEYTHAFAAKDTSGEAAGLKASGCHIIWRVEYGPSGVPSSVAMGELRIPALITGGCMEAERSEHWKDTGGMCNYMLTTCYLPPAKVTKKTIPFLDGFFAKNSEHAGYGGYASYDSVYVYKESVERAGTLNTNSLVLSLEKTDYEGVMGRIVFSPKDFLYPHEMEWGPQYVPFGAVQWEEGKQKIVWPDGKEADEALLKLNDRPGWVVRRGWDKLKYEGTEMLKLPPWMLKHYGK
jgi:branched-chain amino acid transport system substrate-binding protein